MEEEKKIRSSEFVRMLEKKADPIIMDLTIVFEVDLDIDLSQISDCIKFYNCKFVGKNVKFAHKNSIELPTPVSFVFQNCEILNNMYFFNCLIDEIRFTRLHKTIQRVHISAKKMRVFYMEPNVTSKGPPFPLINMYISNCEITQQLILEDIKSTGTLSIGNCLIKDNLRLILCEFNSLSISSTTFENVMFLKNKFSEYSFFQNNEFNELNLISQEFGKFVRFYDNTFKGRSSFRFLTGNQQMNVEFSRCIFEQHANFNDSKLHSLSLTDLRFKEISSFQNVSVNSINIERTVFEQHSFFDDIDIHDVINCSKRTIRTIKQQLLRSDNKIDFDIFRAHELEVHRLELRKKKIKSYNVWKDLLILEITYFFSDNGTNWIKSLRNTLIVGYVSYSIFFIIYYSSNSLPNGLLSAYNMYFLGLIKFLLVTDLHDPFSNEKEYLKTIASWIPFAIGKISLGIGLYETIVSFRKFKS